MPEAFVVRVGDSNISGVVGIGSDGESNRLSVVGVGDGSGVTSSVVALTGGGRGMGMDGSNGSGNEGLGTVRCR